MDLHEAAGEDDEALHDRPRGDVAHVGLEDVEVARLQPAGELLELPHRLDALVDVHEGVGEGLENVHSSSLVDFDAVLNRILFNLSKVKIQT